MESSQLSYGPPDERDCCSPFLMLVYILTGILYIAIRIAVMDHYHIGNIPLDDRLGYAGFGFLIWPALLVVDIGLGFFFVIAKIIVGMAVYLSGS